MDKFENKLKLPMITFKAGSKQYQIEPQKPIEGISYQEIREKANREVEIYMFNNSISGPYQLCFFVN